MQSYLFNTKLINEIHEKSIRTEGFLIGFSEGFAESFNKIFIKDLEIVSDPKLMQEVFRFYTEAFTNRFIKIITEYCNKGELSPINHSDIIKIANAAEKNGRIRLLKNLAENKIFTEEQMKGLVAGDIIGNISLEKYQGNEVLIKELIDAGFLAEERAEQLQGTN